MPKVLPSPRAPILLLLLLLLLMKPHTTALLKLLISLTKKSDLYLTRCKRPQAPCRRIVLSQLRVLIPKLLLTPRDLRLLREATLRLLPPTPLPLKGQTLLREATLRLLPPTPQLMKGQTLLKGAESRRLPMSTIFPSRSLSLRRQRLSLLLHRRMDQTSPRVLGRPRPQPLDLRLRLRLAQLLVARSSLRSR